jgi:hypothetical protein
MTFRQPNQRLFRAGTFRLFLLLAPTSSLVACAVATDSEVPADEDLASAQLALGTQIETEPNDSPGASGVRTITWGDDNRGTLSPTDPVDYWSLVVPARTYLNLYLGNVPTGSDYDLYLTQNGQPIWSGTNGGSADEIVVRLDVQPGTYSLKVVAYQNPQANQTYLLRVASTAVSRARQWVTVNMPYCQAANGQHDAQCGGTCQRLGAASSPQWDPYRSDCSGYVSWAWGLAAPGLTTSTLSTRFAAIAANQLQPGDILLRAGVHVVLFEQWLDQATGRARILEEQSCGKVAAPRDVTLGGVSTGTTVTLDGASYTARRFTMP